jgi:pimeloyl-ACP methyl ester carboxylesterase
VEHGFVRIPGAEVHYLEAGQGPPLVLVHGLAASWRWWTPVLDQLTAHHHVYAFDLPGFGDTRAEEWFSLKSAGRFVCQVMAALGLKQAALMGHSMGGRICMDVAVNCPDLVRKLVLVSTIGLPFGKSYPEVGLDLVRETRATPPEYQDLVRADAKRVRFLELALATYQVLSDDFRAHLNRVCAETLIVWGGRDVLTHPQRAFELASLIPQAHLTILPEAGHNPMWDQPELFSERVLDFLGSAVPAAQREGERDMGRRGALVPSSFEAPRLTADSQRRLSHSAA